LTSGVERERRSPRPWNAAPAPRATGRGVAAAEAEAEEDPARQARIHRRRASSSTLPRAVERQDSHAPAPILRPVDHDDLRLEPSDADGTELPAVGGRAREVPFDPPLVGAEDPVPHAFAGTGREALHHLVTGSIRMLDDD